MQVQFSMAIEKVEHVHGCFHKHLRMGTARIKEVKNWSEVKAEGQTLRSISSHAGLKLLNSLVSVLVTLSSITFNYDTDHNCGYDTE